MSENKNIRIVQLIDSLEPGGAERMAVNFANALANKIEFSALVATRKEGTLKKQLSNEVHYLFINKKSNYDINSFFKTRRFISQNKIDFIHAHSSSFFWAVLLKMTYPKLKVVWHDHYGNRINEIKSKNRILICFSFFFHHVLTVNPDLESWALKNLLVKKVSFLPNFLVDKKDKEQNEIILNGDGNKKIVFLANLKNPKNHFSFIKAFHESGIVSNGWSLHLIGKDFSDNYSKEIRNFIKSNKLEEVVFLYGSCNSIDLILKQAIVGVLASTFEGFPVTLLEYAKAKLFVLSTKVGYCNQIVKDREDGYVFDPNDNLEMINSLKELSSLDEKLRNQMAEKFHDRTIKNYGENEVISKYLSILTNG